MWWPVMWLIISNSSVNGRWVIPHSTEKCRAEFFQMPIFINQVNLCLSYKVEQVFLKRRWYSFLITVCFKFRKGDGFGSLLNPHNGWPVKILTLDILNFLCWVSQLLLALIANIWCSVMMILFWSLKRHPVW